MYQWARPEIAVPTHGERRHLLEHCALARDLQIPQQIAPKNGDMVRLAPGRAAVIDEVPSGRLFVDGNVLEPEGGQALRERRHAAQNGVLLVTLALDKKGKLASEIEVRGLGLTGDADYPLEDALDDLADRAREALNRLNGDARFDDEAVEQAIGRSLKKASQQIWDRRPIVETVVLRL
jgi:ribonuclease J